MALRVRNKVLYSRLKKFTVTSIDLLQKRVGKEDLPQKKIRKFLIRKDGFDSHAETGIDFNLLTYTHRKEIAELPEFVNCARYMLKCPPMLRELGIIHEKDRPLSVPFTRECFPVLYLFLKRYLERMNGLHFEESNFKEMYVELENYVYRSVIYYKAVAPLQGLSGNVGDVQLSKNLKLRPLSDLERAEYLEMQLMNGSSSLRLRNQDLVRIAEAGYALETVFSYPKGAQPPISAYRETLEHGLTLLQLFKSGRVSFGVVKIELTLWNPFRPTGTRYETCREVKDFRNSYNLDMSEKRELQRFCRKFMSFLQKTALHVNGKPIALALRRFKSGIEEDDIENQIIDFFIGLEALYSMERDELAYRLSTRAAILLGENDVETERIKEFLSKGYSNIRSSIVHGKIPPTLRIKGEKTELSEFTEKVEGYLRESLKSFIFLSDVKREEPIVRSLDRSLIDVTLRKKLRLVAKPRRRLKNF